MKLIILHLSDMHFDDDANFSDENIVAIAKALNQSMSEENNILVIISGDLTYSGKKVQGKQIEKFLNTLRNEIVGRYCVKEYSIAMVPGNHDVDYNRGHLNRQELEEISKSNSYERHISEELKKQSEFYTLAQRYGCFEKNALVYKKDIQCATVRIGINLINTAIFSSLDEDQGFHYLPEKAIQMLREQKESDFVISVMHHPHHWYCWQCKKTLEEALYSRSDIIFVGHEHYESTMHINTPKASVKILAGGMLCNRGNWQSSEFHIGILDLCDREYISRKYSWNSAAKIYEETDIEKMFLSKNRYNHLGLSVKKNFMNELTADKYMIAKNIQGYFVFPLLVKIDDNPLKENKRISKEINSMADFMNTLRLNKKVIISGTSDSGKSILAKAIYSELSNTNVTLFIKGSEVVKKIERNFKLAFEDAYSNEATHYEAFKQSPSENLAVIIDDVDNIDPTIQNNFLDYTLEHFGVIVEIHNTEIDVDIKSRLQNLATHKDFVHYNIEPFYSDKRKELVSNIVKQCVKNDDESRDTIITVLCEVLTKQKYLYGWNPDFIVQFVKYYCNNIGEAIHNDGSIFSKVFESNIVQLIKPYARKITVDKILMILDKIAYGLYIKKEYPVSLKLVNEIIENYNNDYASKINTTDFMNLLIDAKIFKKCANQYLFFDRNYLSYFVAREIKRKCLEDSDYEQFNHVVKYSYSGLNANILLFVTYITDNLNIIKMIMQYSENVTLNWKEFDLKKIDIPFLVNTAEQIINPYRDSDKKRAEEQQIEKEKEEAKSLLQENDSSIFDREDESLDFMQEILRSISLMIILARTLPSFEHLMKKNDKKKCVELIYKMPLKIFEKLAKEIDGISRELLMDIKNFHEYEFRKDKPNISPLEDYQALHILKWEVISILLELMNSAMSNATRENTNYFIDNFFEYKNSPTYAIEHIMGLSKRDDVLNFITETTNIFSQNKDMLIKNMIQRITKNFIVNLKKIKASEIDHLNAKIFKDALIANRILIEQGKNKSKF